MSIQSTSISMSKEMSVEESYSKTSVSSSVMSSKMESMEMSSSTIGDMKSITDSGISSLAGKLDSALAISDSGLSGGLKMSSIEKSASLMQSEDSFSMMKSEVVSSSEVQESSKSMSMVSSKEEVSMSKSESVSKSITKSESISSEVSEEKPSVFVVVMDYTPREGDKEGLAVTEGQEVEVIDSSRAHKWRVRLRSDGSEGNVPSCYLEKKTATTPPESPQLDPKAQAAMTRREKVLKELVESEEAFARDMQFVVDKYIKEMESKTMPKELRDYKESLFSNFKAISEFHNNVLMKGIQYYIDDPARVGKTFLRLERDFDKHVAYCRDEPEAQQILQSGPLKEYFDNFSKSIDDEKTLSEHLKLPIQRINDYQLLLKELIKYTARLKESTEDLEKAHDFMQAIPQRIADLQYINSIQGYKGNLHKLGRILKHDWFEVTDSSGLRRERFVFLFKARIFVTDHKRVGTHKSIYLVKNVIKLPEVEIIDNADDDELKLRFQNLKPGVPGFPLTLKSRTLEQKEDWLSAIHTSSKLPVDDLGEEELDVVEVHEKQEAKVEVVEDFEAYEEMHTVITESVRSGSLTSLEDFHSALEDEPSLCLTASDLESGGPGRPRFTVPLKAQACAEGAELVLECEVCANPEATVAWLKDNAPLTTSERAILKADGGRHRLVISKAECQDSGLYTMIASNLHGTTSCSAPLTVSSAPGTLPPTNPDGSPLPYGPIFQEKLRNIEIQEGTDFRVCVIVQGEPTPSVKFYKDDQEIGSVGRVRYHQDTKECYELIIDNAMAEDIGKYSCVANSSAGQNVTSCDIKVTSGLPREPESPKITAAATEVQAKEGSSALLEMTATGFPKPIITWSKDGEELTPGDKYVMLQEDEETYTMAIKSVTPDDSGKYCAEAINDLGKDELVYDLKVTSPPTFTKQLKDSSASIGEDAELAVEVKGSPEPTVTWSKDGQPLSPSDHVQMTSDGKVRKLVIKNARSEDAGHYSCTLKNEHGTQATFGALQVNSAAKFVKGLSDTVVNAGQDVCFAITVSGNPTPKIRWIKDGQELEVDGSHLVMREETENSYTLTIRHAEESDVGEYCCELSNIHGKDTSKAKLGIKEKLEFRQGFTDSEVKESEDVEFKLKISGTPKPSIKWAKDGSELRVDGERIQVRQDDSDGSLVLVIKKTHVQDSGEYTCTITSAEGSESTSGKLTVKEKLGFKKTLTDTEVKEGQDVELKVEVTGTPKPTVKWTKDGNDISTDGERVELKKQGSEECLIIRKSTKKDEGKYTCTVSNSEGSESTSSKVTVKEDTKAPSFTKGMTDKTVTEGETVEFSVKFTGKPSAKWCKDGAELTIDGKHWEYKKEEAEDSLTLILHNATPQDSGSYSCTISNAAGSDTTTSNLVVKAEERAPSFEKGLKDQSVKEGETVSFTVKFTGKPKPSAKWCKDRAELTIDGKHWEYKREEAEDSLTLILNNATLQDSGSYSCTISNAAGSDTTTSNLVVKAEERAPSFEKGLKDQSVKEGETVSFTVKFTGKPKPSAKWNKDGAELTVDNKHIELRYEEEEDSLTLVLKEATKADTGTYSCTITNSAGTDKTSSKLQVTESERAATILKELESVSVLEEESVELTVQFDGTPKPTVKWQKDGIDIATEDDHFEVTSEGNSATLTINDVALTDSGKYSCTVSNVAGSATSSADVTVREDTAPPKFIKGLKDQTVKEGQSIKLTVKYTGKPKPTAKWSKNDTELTIDGSHVKSVSEAEDSLSLIIYEVTQEDAGQYGCTITNSQGTETTSNKLNVSESSWSPEFTQKLKDAEVKEGETVEFNVKISGKPKPTAKWTFDSADLTIDSSHVELKTEEDGASLTLVIRGATKEDAGKYSCTITNSLGSLSSSAKLAVCSAPQFTKKLEDIEAQEGASLKLNVKYEGQPEPTVTWKKDGVALELDGQRLKTSIENDDSLSLVISKLTKQDEGKYSCDVVNPYGQDSTLASVAVTGKPVIKKPLGDQEISEGDSNVEVVVEVIGTPSPQVKWFLEGKEVTEDENFGLSRDESKGLCRLILKKVGPQTQGKLKFIAENSGGKVESSGSLVLLTKPKFLKDLSDVTLSEGDTLKLEALISGSPKPDVSWFYGKKEIKPDDEHELASEGESYTMTMEEASVENSGTYTCKARNKVGEASQKATVTVKSKKDTQAPMFVTHLHDQVIVVGDAARFEVKVTGKPQPDVTWCRGDTELSDSDRILIKVDGNNYTLTLKDLKPDDSAKYRCKAVNQYGEATEAALLTVKEPMAPHIEELQDAEVRYGTPAKLKAKITGFPYPDVKWLKDDAPIKTGGEYEITADVEGKRYIVSIKSVKADEIGRYTCIATNSAGEAKSDCTVAIKAQPPVFAKDMQDSVVDLGQGFSFEVEVYGYPTPEISWFKDNKPIQSNGLFLTSKNADVYKLEGKTKNLDDAGIFMCKAINKAGEDSRKATLQISDFAPLVTEKLPAKVDLVEGDKLELKAKFTGKPTPEIKWQKDGKPLKPSNHLTMSVSPDGVAELTVSDVTHDDAGFYRLIATNDKGHVDTESSVGVSFKAKSTKPFVGQLHPVDVTLGNPIVMEAKVTGNPKPKVEWTKDGKKVESDDHVRLSEMESKAILIIHAAKAEDAGEYKLTASNEEGEDSSTADVKVSAPDKKPTIVKELKAAKLIEGEEGKLEVVVAGHPMPTVAWMHNGKNVLEGKHCSVKMDLNGTATLILHGVRCEDGGMYSVIATNKLGKAVTEAPIIVSPVMHEESEKKHAKVFEFLQSLMPQLVPEGSPCTLEAKVTTDPKPVSVKWLKDSHDIPPSERIEIFQDSTGCLKLCIKHLTPADRGKYAVLVSDGNTEIRSEALVNMLPSMPGMSGNKPYFVKGLEPLKVSEGETVKLQAELPPNSGCKIKWMKDGDDVVKSDRIQILEQPNGAIALIVEAATPEDSGKYVVVATNDEGKTRSSAMVAVVGAGFKLPEIVETLKPASFIEGEPGKLTAKVNGEPKPEVKWLKDGVPVEPNDRIRTRTEPDGTVTLEFESVKPEDAGKYTVLVSNLGGETRTSAPVDIIRSPIFLKPLESTTGVYDCPAKLECKVSGDPAPEIKWMKDGADVPDDNSNVRKQRMPNGEVALVFDKCKPEHAGSYTCTASNQHGEKSSSAPFTVRSREVEGESTSAPVFLTPLSDLQAKEGETFRLETTVSGNPLPDVHWFLDEQPLSCSPTILPSFDGKKATLTVYRCNPQHAGTYECKISNALDSADSKCKVSVLAHKPPKFIERLYDAQFLSSEPMKLVCRVDGLPEPQVDWYFNRSRIEEGIKYQLAREGDKCTLTLPHPRVRDSGLYECRARNESGRDSCTANITVTGADAEGEPAMFLKKLRDTTVLNGMTARLTACVCGVPKPEIKWFRDGTQLSESSRLTLEADPNGVVRLIIHGVKRCDIGTYRVSIANKFGSDTCTATLDVEGTDKPQPAVQKKEIPRPTTQGPPAPLPHAPYIFKMTDDSISLGWRPSIPTFPQVPFTYRLEMCKLPDGEWSPYKSGIKDSSCDIRDLVPGADYAFRVRVENRYGISDPSPYLTAPRTRLFRPLTPADYAPKDYELEHLKLDKYAAAPRFLRLEEDSTYAVRGHPARIEFWVYGCPQPKITWYFNNIPVEAGKYDFLEDRGGQVILFITRMGDDDVGTYMCKAENEHGEAQRKTKLLIAEAPAFSKRLDPTTTLIRKGAEFRCKVVGMPTPKIKWFKDWHPLSESSRIHIRFEEPDTCVLTLSDAILKDGGLYTCTATNVAGSATTSAMLSVEESENEYYLLTYKRPHIVKPSEKPFEDFYDIGDELGRGTQGITYHVVERKTGRSLAAKVMHGEGKLMDAMTAEMDIMNQLCHPRLVRLWDAHATKSSLTLAMDICGGGELLPAIIHHDRLTESIVAHYIKQILEGLEHMHEKNIAHLGLTIGDVLLTRVHCDNIKIADFGLATRLYQGREFVQEYGHPEFVAPEVANKQPVSLAADMWSVGIIAYILLVGDSPFLRENDRETLKEVQKGRPDFYHDGFVVLSDEARDFVQQLLQPDPSKRMDVSAALKHKWLQLDALPDICDELSNIDRLREYYRRWKSWYANASCRWFFRRRTLESCFTHPSRMIYPPDEGYTPPSTPDREPDRSHVKPAAFDDVTFRQRIEREAIDPRSESHYQSGPDTFLLPLRDPDFPVRVRRYLKVGANRSPLLARHLTDKHWGYSDVAVKERRKFVDVMDEEITDEQRGLTRSANLRLRSEVGTVGSGYEHLETRAQKKKRGFRGTQGAAPFFREKMKHVVVREEEEAVFSCRVTASPDAQVSWFRNDGILIESSRIIMSKWSDGRCSLTLRPAKAYDVGVYKCVARNPLGVTVSRARLDLGSVSAKPEPPKAEKCSDTEIYLIWLPPKFDGCCPAYGYALEYKEASIESWTKLASNISHEFYLVRNLSPATTYYFRVCAVNKFGWSEFSDPSDPIMTMAEATAKIELSKAEKFQQDQTDSGQELLMDMADLLKLDYGREDEPVVLEEEEPTDIYNYISEIAKGRFSLVMKVWHKKVNSAFVAKALDLSDAARHEFDIHRTLQHEKIVGLHSASVSSKSLFLVMEKLSGIDVLTYLSSKPLYTEEVVSRIIHQVIDGLEYLHFRGICYLELQPDNVVMEDRYLPNIKLVDMGSALYLPEEGAKVPIRGDIEYLAPEILKGEDVHTPADIWGVGVLTYILLSGVSPFAGESTKETKDNVAYVRYHFDNLFKEATPEATNFLMQLFKRTPQKRPTTEECLENKWLLPNEFMIKKREHAVFLSHPLRDFSERFHSAKAASTPSHLLSIFGKPEAR